MSAFPVSFLRKLVPASRAGSLSLARTNGLLPQSSSKPDVDRGESIASARLLCEAGRFAEALVAIDDRLISDTQDHELLFARASTLFACGRHREALALLLRLERSGLRDAALYTKLGWASFWLGRMGEAEACMLKAVSLQSDDWSTHFGLASVLRACKRAPEATVEFERALELKPDDAHCLSNLVACGVELDRLDEAERYARDALARAPASSSATIDLGIVLCSQARYAESVKAFELADALEFDAVDARDESVNYAICLLRAGRIRQALDVTRRKLRLHPGGALHYHYALALLTTGRFAEGWEQYEFRWLQEPLLSWRQDFGKPVWAGQDLRGKTILLRAEQGYGDFIQFIRFAPYIKALGATVLLYAREELHGLVEGNQAIDRILGSDEPYPPFDYHIHLLSIPRVLGIALDSIPSQVPYIRADPRRTTALGDVAPRDEMLNVGIVWAGSPTHLGDRFRSLPAPQLARLLQVDGVRFHALQKGPAALQLATLPEGAKAIELGSRLQTFADTAAAIDAMDLVIGVDTAVIHLAGAMAKPVWTLVAIPGDWRWLEHREDSPWYPTMRLFRQPEPGDWNGVVERVISNLQVEIERHRSGRSPRAVDGVPGERVPSATITRPRLAQPAVDCDLCRITETRHGIVMYFPDESRSARAIEFYGESNQLRLTELLRLTRSGMAVIDCAVGCGIDSLALARALGSAGHLIVYENDPLQRQVVGENLKSNRIDNVTLMRRPLEFRPVFDRDTATAFAHRSPQPESAPMSSETIDDLRLEQLHWLRIGERADPENVLRGAEATLWRLRPGLFIEFVDEAALARAGAAAKDRGYACWRARFPWFNTENFNRRDDDLFGDAMAHVLIALPEEAGLELPIAGGEKLA